MPTGYTHEIYEGKDISAAEFILKCARNFGATIMMRDEPLDKPIPEFEPDKYHFNAILKAKKELEEVSKLTLEDAELQVEKDYEDALKRHQKRKKEYDELQVRYEKVLHEVEKWIPPTPDHVNLKEYAMDQLTQSISFDCNQRYLTIPVKDNPETWLINKKYSIENKIKYHEKEWGEEVKRTKGRNKWVRELKDSLGGLNNG